MQLTHIKSLEIAVCLQLHLERTHRQLLIQHRAHIFRVCTTHTSEIEDVTLSDLTFAHQRKLAWILIVEGIHVHAISQGQVAIFRSHVELGNGQSQRIHLHPTLRFCNGQP